MLDLTELNNHIIDDITINDIIDLPTTYFKESGILELKQLKVDGNIYKNSNDDNVLNLVIKGEMVIPDAISLEPVTYPFIIDIQDEILEKDENDENSLDFMRFLWQNIALEIPLKFTKVTDFSEFQGTGWKLISEDELKDAQNPFNNLKSKLGEE